MTNKVGNQDGRFHITAYFHSSPYFAPRASPSDGLFSPSAVDQPYELRDRLKLAELRAAKRRGHAPVRANELLQLLSPSTHSRRVEEAVRTE